jgi:hypothetical protein
MPNYVAYYLGIFQIILGIVNIPVIAIAQKPMILYGTYAVVVGLFVLNFALIIANPSCG